ncbi:type II secretion system F family protein [Roseateles violae]|uniref:Type II secretion system F family protein n=1 Tax=Roseateles violae TaxID=3058042 RepID=A0ABT8DTQ9_9BURK|nr:type II secretion system F family protein [Pelomonas sp. PFR6]MDN3921685.1 type II secretion system F family protein [Pelomonas sp. PFR6]
MESFRYKGRNKLGQLMQGNIESTSAQAVAQWMLATEIFPISIKSLPKPAKQPEWFTRMTGENKVADLDLLMFTRQMGNMVRAGLPLMESVDGIRKSTGSKALAKILQAVREDLDKGNNLSAALARHPQVFNDFYVNMIRVGESSGKLEQSFQGLYQQIEFDRDMRKKVKSAVRYPSFVLGALGIGMSILTVFVIPVFAKTYANLHADLPTLTVILIATSKFLREYWWLVIAAMVGAVFLVRRVLAAPRGRYAWDRFKLRLPVVGKIFTKVTVARFCRTFGMAVSSGVPIVQAFSLAARVVENAHYEQRILQMRHGVERGDTISKVASQAGIFSPLELQMISVGEQTGEIDSMLEQIALIHQEDVDYEISKLSASIEPLLLAVMGVLVGIVLLGVFLPLWDLGQAALHPKAPQ